jgi:Leucine-rich repeat (LRR) protein
MDPAVLKALIKDSKKTKRLDLSHNNLDAVPDEVIKAHHLERLILNNNNITEMPSQLLKSK